ncbi:MAG: 4-alpha-glucanotransferase, partial [Nitrospirae bacterium]
RGEDGKERWFFLPVSDLEETPGEKGGEVRYSMTLPPGISPGYYELNIQVRSEKGKVSGRSLLITPPHRAYLPEKVEKGKRLWGVGLNLYSLSSEGNLGIGDFGDLEKIIRLVSEEGGDFISINPLHHISNIEPAGVSPYFPVSRLYVNPIYIDHRQLPDIENSETARRFMDSDEFNLIVGRIKSGQLIDYNAVSELKMQLLGDGFDWFYENEYKRGTHRGDDFRRYMKAEGEPLELHAAFILLDEKFRKEGVDHWKGWGITPGNLKDERVKEFIRLNEKELLFQKYLQWVGAEQIARLRELTMRAGMSVGLLNDLALGVPEMSSEVFGRPELFARGVTVGAPPDDFSPLGQDWGFPPLIPGRLRDDGYGFLRQLFSSNLNRGGGLRIDHILGFFRMFWIPEGFSPKEGVYVRY